MAKDKRVEAEYKAEGRKRIISRKHKRKNKISTKVAERERKAKDCCEGDPRCNGTTDCMWY